MKCPKCGNMETKVSDSRVVEDGKCIRRRRACEYCEHRFTTYERIAVTDLIVIKRDESREMYDRSKLSKALIIAFGKKGFSMEKIDEMILRLEAKWSGMGKEITSTKIGEDVLAMLKETDEIAYVRFASVFMEFEDLKDFKRILK